MLPSPHPRMHRSAPRPRLLLLFAALAGCGSGAVTDWEPEPPPPPLQCVVATAECVERVNLGLGRYLPVYRTYALGKRDARVERVVVVVHGADRNADAYFNTMVAALQAAGTLSSTLVVSPRFQAIEDTPRSDEPYWSTEGWKHGDLSASDSPLARVS